MLKARLESGLLLGGSLGGGGGGRGSDGLGLAVLGADLDGGLGLGVDDLDKVGHGLGGTLLSLGVVGLEDLDLDTKDTLTEENVTDGVVDVVASGLTGVDKETLGELHRLGTSSTELARDNDLTTVGARLHNVTEDTVAGTDVSRIREIIESRLTRKQLTGAWQDHRGACSGGTRPGRRRKDHGTGPSRRRARGSSRGT